MKKEELKNMKQYNWIFNLFEKNDLTEKYFLGIIAAIIGIFIAMFNNTTHMNRVFLLFGLLFLVICGTTIIINIARRAEFRSKLYFAAVTDKLESINLEEEKKKEEFREKRWKTVALICYLDLCTMIGVFMVMGSQGIALLK
ncbi:hypothetical protein FV113G1_11310 [Fusobacterium varium]|nr:hypothetical protein FV113G1_11310 [Fusobacterium varium]